MTQSSKEAMESLGEWNAKYLLKMYFKFMLPFLIAYALMYAINAFSPYQVRFWQVFLPIIAIRLIWAYIKRRNMNNEK